MKDFAGCCFLILFKNTNYSTIHSATYQIDQNHQLIKKLSILESKHMMYALTQIGFYNTRSKENDKANCKKASTVLINIYKTGSENGLKNYLYFFSNIFFSGVLLQCSFTGTDY